MSHSDREQTLQGLSLLSVRPFASEQVTSAQLIKQGTGSFSQLLAARGARLRHFPVMNLVYPQSDREFERIKTAIMALAEFDKAIVVSTTAARQVLDWVDKYWPQLPLRPDFFAVGESSANILRSYPMTVSCPSQQMTSEGLLSLPQFEQVSQQKIVIFRGVGGRETLANRLRELGAEISYVNLYQREFCTDYKTEINQLIEGRVPLLVAHSGELLKNVIKICRPGNRQALYNRLLLVPSRRLENFAVAQGFNRVLVAKNASPAEMVATIESWYLTVKNID